MSDGLDGLTASEPSLVRLYVELTGASESAARSVFMHVCCWEREDETLPDGNGTGSLLPEQPMRFSRAPISVPAGGWLSRTVIVPAGG